MNDAERILMIRMSKRQAGLVYEALVEYANAASQFQDVEIGADVQEIERLAEAIMKQIKDVS